MKTLIVLSLMTAATANASFYSCKAGKIELINLNAKFSDEKVVLTFKSSNNESVAQDLNGKKVTLPFTEENHGWKKFEGRLLVQNLLKDYRYFEVGINPETPVGSDTLKGHMAMSPRSTDIGPTYLSQYDLNCTRTSL